MQLVLIDLLIDWMYVATNRHSHANIQKFQQNQLKALLFASIMHFSNTKMIFMFILLSKRFLVVMDQTMEWSLLLFSGSETKNFDSTSKK